MTVFCMSGTELDPQNSKVKGTEIILNFTGVYKTNINMKIGERDDIL